MRYVGNSGGLQNWWPWGRLPGEEVLYPTLLKQGPQSACHFDVPCHNVFIIVCGMNNLQVRAWRQGRVTFRRQPRLSQGSECIELGLNLGKAS